MEEIKKKENYIYPARMNYVDGMYQIRFIDFPDMILIEEADREEAIRSAQKSLALEILDYESRNEKLPDPNEEELNVIYVHIWMPYFRNTTKEIYVKKNVTIPRWLDIDAKENKISFSAALVKELKAELGIKY